jgi:hypothetical protein
MKAKLEEIADEVRVNYGKKVARRNQRKLDPR